MKKTSYKIRIGQDPEDPEKVITVQGYKVSEAFAARKDGNRLMPWVLDVLPSGWFMCRAWTRKAIVKAVEELLKIADDWVWSSIDGDNPADKALTKKQHRDAVLLRRTWQAGTTYSLEP